MSTSQDSCSYFRGFSFPHSFTNVSERGLVTDYFIFQFHPMLVYKIIALLCCAAIVVSLVLAIVWALIETLIAKFISTGAEKREQELLSQLNELLEFSRTKALGFKACPSVEEDNEANEEEAEEEVEGEAEEDSQQSVSEVVNVVRDFDYSGEPFNLEALNFEDLRSDSDPDPDSDPDSGSKTLSDCNSTTTDSERPASCCKSNEPNEPNQTQSSHEPLVVVPQDSGDSPCQASSSNSSLSSFISTFATAVSSPSDTSDSSLPATPSCTTLMSEAQAELALADTPSSEHLSLASSSSTEHQQDLVPCSLYSSHEVVRTSSFSFSSRTTRIVQLQTSPSIFQTQQPLARTQRAMERKPLRSTRKPLRFS